MVEHRALAEAVGKAAAVGLRIRPFHTVEIRVAHQARRVSALNVVARCAALDVPLGQLSVPSAAGPHATADRAPVRPAVPGGAVQEGPGRTGFRVALHAGRRGLVTNVALLLFPLGVNRVPVAVVQIVHLADNQRAGSAAGQSVGRKILVG